MSRDVVKEDVPWISRRIGDQVISGGNNAAIILGRDRVKDVDSGYGSASHPGGGRGAGAVHITVGRSSNDPSILDDAAGVYISQKSDPDDLVPSRGPAAIAESAVIARADCVRVSGRRSIRLTCGSAHISLSSDGRITIEGNISLEEEASQSIIRGEAFSAFWNTVRVPTPAGLSGPLPPLPPSLFTTRSKVK